jgi:hypothetical protein
MVFWEFFEKPNMTFIHVLKKKVGASKYKRIIRKMARRGNKSKKKLKKINSAIKKIEPGKPKKIKQLVRITRNSLGQRKFIPCISVMSRVLNLLFIASTSKKELVDKRA